MAHQGSLVRVDRGDGYLFKMTPKDAAAFVASNSGAKIVPTPGPASDEIEMPGQPAEVEAGFASMKKADLEAYAAEHDIDISGAKNNAERVALIEAATAASAGEGDEDEGDEDEEQE